MRRAAAFLVPIATLLAGCTGGTTGDDAFQPTCPAWRQGLSTSTFQSVFHQNSTQPGPRKDVLGAGLLDDDGKPLDKLVVDFRERTRPDGTSAPQGVALQDSRLSLRATADDDGRTLRLYDPAHGPLSARNPGTETWTFEPGTLHSGFSLQVDLVAPDQPASPTSVTLWWDWERDLDRDSDTHTGAQVAYTALYLYRTC